MYNVIVPTLKIVWHEVRNIQTNKLPIYKNIEQAIIGLLNSETPLRIEFGLDVSTDKCSQSQYKDWKYRTKNISVLLISVLHHEKREEMKIVII